MSKLLSICMVLLVGCSSLAAPTPTPTPIPTSTLIPTPTLVYYYPDLSIGLGQQVGLGYSPTYGLQIDADGNVRYRGRSGVAVRGERTAKITHQQVQELVDAIQRANVFAMEDQYGHMLDVPTTGFSVTLNGQNKSIRHAAFVNCKEYHGGPPVALCELERKIETTVNVDQWVEPIPLP